MIMSKISPTELFYLRCLQTGLSLTETDLLTVGEIFVMIIESSNDHTEGEEVRNATQKDIEWLKRM